MQAASWTLDEVSGAVLARDLYFPHSDASGQMYAQVFQSSSSGGSESACTLMYLLSIAPPAKTIDSGDGLLRTRRSHKRGAGGRKNRGGPRRLILPGHTTPIQISLSATLRALVGGRYCRPVH